MRREAHFVHDGFVRGRWVDVFAYAMLADEWRTRRQWKASGMTALLSPKLGAKAQPKKATVNAAE
jgi:hypothetical protein